ncbi:protein DBF4 homolog B [Micropterus dolomieu]|uniref:protein DBF4 homolog B n=1 Tax=Micropterus dolomieu TaxID=147949 RepID=UPI001E8DD57E|nr:protein DBF4 homolog B [Micropterus dolomieu]XP_045924198.1 protein DBF4 homolog B [Micropterus dolomieu]XP_045924199.1 protein DBF4 homolog B [Micropterus dolomieu]
MQHRQYAKEQGLLGSLCPGQKKLEGKTFYLDSVKKRSTALLLETIYLLGGGVESFLHKDVSFVVTGSQECLKDMKCTDSKAGAKGTSEETQRPIMTRDSDKQQKATPRPVVCGSRGKALLEKAMRNNERLQRNSVLSNARSWGVKILYADDVLLYLKQLTRESLSAIHEKPERTYTKQQGAHVVKAAALRSPYLKIEDSSRKYKPLHMQSLTFPTLSYSGRFSPFESPPPRFEVQIDQGENKTREKKKVGSNIQDKSQTPLSCNPTPWRPRKKDLSYCECCHQPFTNLEEHLQSDQHRAFVLDLSNYTAVDQLVAEMLPGFDPNPPQQSEETLNRPPSPLPIQDVCELEPLTDVETEHAVQALQTQGSVFIEHISSPTRGPLSSGPANPSPDTPPADIQPFITNPDCLLPGSYHRASSPAMPVLDVEPQPYDPVSQQPDTQHVSPSPDRPCPSPDPYFLPPVLSPQVPYPPYIMEPYCLYSEPPVLSPQHYTAEEAVEGLMCEMDTAVSVSQSVPAVTIPISTPLILSVALSNEEGVNGSNQESLLGFSGIICPTNGLQCSALYPRRSRSLPRQSATAPNPKKRCRSASPEHSQYKRRRITAKCSYSGSWTKHGHNTAKLESDIMAKPEDCLLCDKISCQIIQSFPYQKDSSTCSVETLCVNETFTTFCVPTAQNFTRAPNQLDILPLFSKAKIFDPPFHFPNNKSHSTFSSQDSQRSLSHSTSVCIESALIPDLATLSPSSSDSDWDCDLLSRLGPALDAPLSPTVQSYELDKDLLHRPCTWMHDTSYESRLHNALQPSTPTTSLCGEEMDPSAFSRTVVQIVEVQH